MICRYIEVALKRAHYELIEDDEPFYGEVAELQGVWATGKSLEECRERLGEAIEDWLVFSLANGFPIPALGDVVIRVPEKVAV